MIYHLTNPDHWNQAQSQGSYRFCSLQSEGFIHCSTGTQFTEVANRLFRQQNPLLLLEIDENLVNSEIRYENLEGGLELFPHIYGPIPVAAVQKVYTLERLQNGDVISPL